jgi:hypothetical protein
LQYTGERHGIYLLSSDTAVGEELAWDFLAAVRAGRQSFTAYCKEVTRRYVTTHHESTSFISRVSFVKWFFCWLANMKIDFRKEVDPWCGHDPDVLACDGTHIGVSMRHMNVDPAITESDRRDVVEPKHKRYNTVLFLTLLFFHMSYDI